MKERIQKCIDHHQLFDYSPDRFLEDLKVTFKKCRNYIRPNFIKSLVCTKDEAFSIVFRILFRIFSKSEKVISLIHCKRLKAKAKLHHAHVAKKLFKMAIS